VPIPKSLHARQILSGSALREIEKREIKTSVPQKNLSVGDKEERTGRENEQCSARGSGAASDGGIGGEEISSFRSRKIRPRVEMIAPTRKSKSKGDKKKKFQRIWVHIKTEIYIKLEMKTGAA